MLTDTDTSCIRLGRNYIRAGDPCRWRGHRGIFRFDGVDTPADETNHRPAVLILFGPASSPRPKQRYVRATDVVRLRPTEGLRAMVAGR